MVYRDDKTVAAQTVAPENDSLQDHTHPNSCFIHANKQENIGKQNAIHALLATKHSNKKGTSTLSTTIHGCFSLARNLSHKGSNETCGMLQNRIIHKSPHSNIR